MTVPRAPSAPVDPQFVERWSPRAFLPDPLSEADVLSLLEAARWAPSGGNQQPWMCVYATAAEDLERLRAVLEPSNRLWAERAPFILFWFARTHSPRSGEVNRTAMFDVGAAWMSLALQAGRLGLHAHAMGGILLDQVHAALGVPPGEYQAVCAVVVGKRGERDSLPERLREREFPSPRRPVAEWAHAGRYSPG